MEPVAHGSIYLNTADGRFYIQLHSPPCRKGTGSKCDVPLQTGSVTLGLPAGNGSRPRAATDPTELGQVSKGGMETENSKKYR